MIVLVDENTKSSSLPLCLAVATIITSEGSVSHIVKQYF